MVREGMERCDGERRNGEVCWGEKEWRGVMEREGIERCYLSIFSLPF